MDASVPSLAGAVPDDSWRRIGCPATSSGPGTGPRAECSGVLLVAFLVGLLSSNSAVACAGIFGFLGAARNFTLYVAVSCITALFSLVIGTTFLFGSAALLPAMLGG